MNVKPLDDDLVDTRDPFEADAEEEAKWNEARIVDSMAFTLAFLVDGDPYTGNEDAYRKACWQLVADVRAEQKRER